MNKTKTKKTEGRKAIELTRIEEKIERDKILYVNINQLQKRQSDRLWS